MRRNLDIRKRARDAVMEFILCCRAAGRSEGSLGWLHKDVVVPIAKMVWESRGEAATWRKEEEAKKKKGKSKEMKVNQ